MDEAYWRRHTKPGVAFAVVQKQNRWGLGRHCSRFANDDAARRWIAEHERLGWVLELFLTRLDVDAYHAEKDDDRAGSSTSSS